MNPATVTQNQMTEQGKQEMFAQWEANAPQKPKREDAWFSSLYTEYNTQTGVYCIKAMIEEYDDDGLIELVGLAELEIASNKYTEKYLCSNGKMY